MKIKMKMGNKKMMVMMMMKMMMMMMMMMKMMMMMMMMKMQMQMQMCIVVGVSLAGRMDMPRSKHCQQVELVKHMEKELRYNLVGALLLTFALQWITSSGLALDVGLLLMHANSHCAYQLALRQGDLVVVPDLDNWPTWYSTVFVVQCFSSATCMNYPWPMGSNMPEQPQRPSYMFIPNRCDMRQVGYLLFSLWFAMHCSITAQAGRTTFSLI